MGSGNGKEKASKPGGKDQSNRFLRSTRHAFILAVIAFFVYASTLNNDFAHDDISAIVKNSIVTKGIQAIPEIFATPYRRGFFNTSNDLYRPLSLVMFSAEYQLSGGSPMLFHLVNVLLFAACVVLLFLFLDRLFEGERTAVAFIAALLFALHPIHTEVVANIKSRDELLCFFFGFLSLLLFLKYTAGGKLLQLLAGSLCLFLSLLSKETAVSMLAVIPLVFFFYSNQNKRRSLYITACSVIATGCFLWIRYSVLHAYHADHFTDIRFIDNALVKAPAAASRLATEILIMGRYLKLLLIPYPLVCDYSYNSIPFAGFGDAWVLISLAAYIFLITFGIVRLIKKRKDPFAFGILFFLFTMALFTNIPFLIGAEMAERFVFFASAGFCWLAALLLEQSVLKWNKATTQSTVPEFLKSKKALLLLVPISVIYVALTVRRNTEWKNSATLYEADVQKQPENARLHYFLGNELMIASREEQNPSEKYAMSQAAVSNLKEAISIYPAYDDAHRVIGNGYFFLSQPDSAIIHLKRAIALSPGDLEAKNNLNVVYFSAQKYSDAIDICKELIEKNPQYCEGYNDIGLGYLQMKKYDSAIYILKQGLLVNNSYNPFYENLALSYKLSGNTDSAKKFEALAQKQHSGFRVF